MHHAESLDQHLQRGGGAINMHFGSASSEHDDRHICLNFRIFNRLLEKPLPQPWALLEQGSFSAIGLRVEFGRFGHQGQSLAIDAGFLGSHRGLLCFGLWLLLEEARRSESGSSDTGAASRARPGLRT